MMKKFVRMNKKNSLIQNGYFENSLIYQNHYIYEILYNVCIDNRKKIIESGA